MSFWDKLTNKFVSPPAQEFKVGTGLNQEQTNTAYKTLTKPDVQPTNPGIAKFMNSGFWDKSRFSNTSISDAMSLLANPNISGNTKKQAGIFDTLANPVLGSIGGSDYFATNLEGKVSKETFRKLVSEKNPSKMFDFLVKEKVPVNDAMILSEKLAPAKNINEVKDILANHVPTTDKVANFFAKPEVKQITPIDKLIAEGKVRVVSRNNTDVYQIKKGGQWVNTRNEDSAVKLLTQPRPVKPPVELPPKILEQKMLLEVKKETLNNNMENAGYLLKYVNKKTGELPEVIGNKAKSKFGKMGDQIVTQGGFQDSEQARQAVEDLIQQKKDLATLKKNIAMEEKNYKASIKENKPTSLEQEARKYKSAEEFVNSFKQPNIPDSTIKTFVEKIPKNIISETEVNGYKYKTWQDTFHEVTTVFDGEKPIGFISKTSSGGVSRVGVLPEYRNKGIGTELYKVSGAKTTDVTSLSRSGAETSARASGYKDLTDIWNKTNLKLKETPQPPQKISQIDTTTGEGRSIEIQAHQAQEVLKGGNVPVNVSLPKIIENTVTSVNKKVHLIDTYLTTPSFVMEKIGFGKEAKMLRGAMDNYWKELPKNLDIITKWSKEVPKESNKRIFNFLDGKAIDLNPQEKKVALEIKDWLKNWAKRLGLKEESTISHYITHIFDKELLAKEFDEDLAKIISDKIPGSIYDPFLLKRLGAKGYKQDTWQALDAYVKRGTRKVHLDPVLESIQTKAGSSLEFSNIEKSQFNYIKKYIENINMRPSETETGIDNLAKSMIGYKLGQRPITAVLRYLRQMTFRGMLGLNPTSALRNLSQGINTYATLGEKYTVIGYAKLFNKGAGAELEREGVLNSGFVQDRALSATKKAIEKMDKVLFKFFDTAEKINRGSAYFGAKSQGLAKGMSEEKAVEYAKSIVRKTQFVFDSVDTPVGMGGDIAKTLGQFQSYTTKQIEFLVQMAKDKNYAGFLRYAIAGTAFVYTIGKAFGMDPKELLPWYRFDTPPSLKVPVEIGKAVLNTPNKYGKVPDLKQKLKNVGNSLLGIIPAGSQGKKTFEGIKSVKQGGVFTSSGNIKFQQGQTLPQKAQSILFGKYASQNAKNYFNKDTIKKDEQKPIKKIYDQVQELTKQGKTQEVLNLVKDFTPEQIQIYKDIRTAERAKATVLAEQKMLPLAQKVRRLVKEGKTQEVSILLKDFTKEDQRIFKLVYKKLNTK